MRTTHASRVLPVVALIGCARAGGTGADAGGPGIAGFDAGGDPVDAATLDAAPPDADPACTPAVVNLLANAGFDLGAGGGWIEASSKDYPLVVADSDPGLLGNLAADTAPNLAWLGGDVELDDELRQAITVPASTTALALRGRRWSTSTEFGALVFDEVRIALTTSSGAPLEDVVTYTNADETTGWEDVAIELAAPHAGEAVVLSIAAHNDDVQQSNFFFDSLALDATTCD